MVKISLDKGDKININGVDFVQYNEGSQTQSVKLPSCLGIDERCARSKGCAFSRGCHSVYNRIKQAKEKIPKGYVKENTIPIPGCFGTDLNSKCERNYPGCDSRCIDACKLAYAKIQLAVKQKEVAKPNCFGNCGSLHFIYKCPTCDFKAKCNKSKKKIEQDKIAAARTTISLPECFGYSVRPARCSSDCEYQKSCEDAKVRIADRVRENLKVEKELNKHARPCFGKWKTSVCENKTSCRYTIACKKDTTDRAKETADEIIGLAKMFFKDLAK